MSSEHGHPYLFVIALAAYAIINVVRGVYDLRVGSSRYRWWGDRLMRDAEPIEFWLAIASKFAAVPIAIVIMWFILKSA